MDEALKECMIEEREVVFIGTLQADAMRFHYHASILINEIIKPVTKLSKFLLVAVKLK